MRLTRSELTESPLSISFLLRSGLSIAWPDPNPPNQAIVEVPSYFKAAPVPVEIDLKYLQPEFVKKIK
jgi:hypothetical protein